MIITPRDYFSYSQFSAFKYSKERFLETYYYGKRQDSCFLDLGKRLGTALQFRQKREIKEIRDIRKQIPPAVIYEYEVKATLKNIPLLCYFDGFFPAEYAIHEYKTGTKPSEASWRNQMLFYSVALFLNNKKLPNKITLYWCPTKFNENEQLILTGEVKEYNIKIDIKEVIIFSGEMVKVWEGIKQLCEHEYQKFGILPTQRSEKLKLNTINNIKK